MADKSKAISALAKEVLADKSATAEDILKAMSLVSMHLAHLSAPNLKDVKKYENISAWCYLMALAEKEKMTIADYINKPN